MEQSLFLKYQELPTITKYWFSATVLVSIMVHFELLDPFDLMLTYYEFIEDFELWRPITALLVYPLSGSFVFWCYCIVKYVRYLELEIFGDNRADFVFMLLFNLGLCTFFALLMNTPILMDSMVMSVVYIWSNLNRHCMINFYICPTVNNPFTFKAVYLPWAILLLHFYIREEVPEELTGIAVGHIYFYYKFQQRQLHTPIFIESRFPSRSRRTW